MISIVIPVYNEEKQILKTLEELCKVLSTVTEDFRLIVVDDGSKDGTWAALKDHSEKDSRLKILRFSRNFGKESAIMAGLAAAESNACIIMDADLQHPPQLIPEMIRLWKEGYEVVEAEA